jgi:hypothetical protein
MEPARTLKILWDRRRLVLLGALVAAAAATVSVYSVSLYPPSLVSRSNVFATASTQILVDTPDSAFADLSYELEPLQTRANVFARFLANPAALALIGRQAGIPASAIEAQGPYEQNMPLYQQEPTAEERSSQIIGEGALYRLRFESNPELPIISVFAQAPTEAEAARLAEAVPAALRRYVQRLQRNQHTPAKNRVEIRRLGHATGGVVNAGANTEIAALVFFLVFAGWCIVLVPAHTIARGWRDGGRWEDDEDGRVDRPRAGKGRGPREDAIRAGFSERSH